MLVSDSMLKELFELGSFKQLVALSVDRPGCNVKDEGASYCIGALSFLGRLDDAESVFLKNDWLDTGSKSRAVYWLGVGFARHCKFAKARSYFIENRRSGRHEKSNATVNLYAHLGIAFYYYWTGRLPVALKHAQAANHLCLQEGLVFERVIAQDSIAHLQINLGKVRRGLSIFSQVEEIALAAGFDWIIHALKVSQTLYRSNFGLSHVDAIYELQQLLASQEHSDSYNKANLFIEIGRQQILRGDLIKAKHCLDEACQNVYQSDNLRLTSHLNLVLAFLFEKKGDYAQALHVVKNIYSQNLDNPHRLLLVKARGLEVKLLEVLDTDQVAIDFAKKELKKLTLSTGNYQSIRRLDRESGSFHIYRSPGNDPLGDLLDVVAIEKVKACPKIIQNQCYGLLMQALDVQPKEKIIYFDLHNTSTTLFDEGSVFWLDNLLSDLMRKVIIELSNADFLSKEDICNKVWGQNYHPLRHDPLIYSVISKIRKIHPVLNEWLVNNESGYLMLDGVQVRVHKPESNPKIMGATKNDSEESHFTVIHKELSFRQAKGLRLIEERGSIDARTYRSDLNISEATATRDLAHLYKHKYIDKVGKGRATKYINIREGRDESRL